MSIWREILRGVLPGQYSERAMRERREARKRELGCICPSYASNRGECPVHDARGRVRPGYPIVIEALHTTATCTCGQGERCSHPDCHGEFEDIVRWSEEARGLRAPIARGGDHDAS